MDFYQFYMGHVFDAYEFLGAHREGENVVFRTFAPGARGIEVLLDGRNVPMAKVHDGNFYEAVIPDVAEGQTYEYRIWKGDNSYTDHCDPYGFAMERRPAHKSIVRELSAYSFQDAKWMKKRSSMTQEPLNIYEMHAGSFKKPGEEPDAWYNYEELADYLIPYLKENGFNYVEFLPLCEHPSDESWGYQNTGYFAPTSRYGTPDQLKKLIDRLHQNQIGVILDFVPVHFAMDEYALRQYDGTALYEYPHEHVGVSEWGSCNFMHSRGEVRSFLQSSANYWLKEFHFDGLRMDAISRIIYWQGDERRGVNGNAVDFIKVMNKGLKSLNPGCMLIAEDSTNFANITKDVDQGGLGFDYKWDMGWMNDTLNYFRTDPEYRTENYHKLTFSMMYFYNEQYLLPLSHDEVVHEKATILQKMAGDYEDKFPQGRALYLYMMVHPGKKLNFMGNELGQLREWDEKREQDWMLEDYPLHASFHEYMKQLSGLYQSHSAFWEEDFDKEGFAWIDCHQEARCIYALERKSRSERLIAVFNFSRQYQDGYAFNVPGCKGISLLLHTDWEQFAGKTPKGQEQIRLDGETISCMLPPFSGVLLKVEE